MTTPIYNPVIPYTGPILGGLNPGQIITIEGAVRMPASRFAINLQCGPSVNPRDDIALHINPRFTYPPTIARNSLQSQSWGMEESHGPCIMEPGKPFNIQIHIGPNDYKIHVNGAYVAEFRHRMPLQRVSYIAIDGDVNVSLIRVDGVGPAGYAPTMAPAAPYPTQQPYPTTSSYPVGTVPPPPPGYVPQPPGPVYATGAYPGATMYPPQTMYGRTSPLPIPGSVIPIGGAAVLGGVLGHKVAKKQHKAMKKAMKKMGKHKHSHHMFPHKFKHKYHHHGFHGHHGFRRGSSSSSSSEEE